MVATSPLSELWESARPLLRMHFVERHNGRTGAWLNGGVLLGTSLAFTAVGVAFTGLRGRLSTAMTARDLALYSRCIREGVAIAGAMLPLVGVATLARARLRIGFSNRAWRDYLVCGGGGFRYRLVFTQWWCH